jgi:hypothetical protein
MIAHARVALYPPLLRGRAGWGWRFADPERVPKVKKWFGFG